MTLIRLALASIYARRGAAMLAVGSIALSVALLLSVETLRRSAYTSFLNTVSGVDVIVGARGGGVQLMLYSVFRIGSATNNFTFDSYQAIAEHPDVEWIVPISLGDSYRGYRVVGTTTEFFARYRYRRDAALAFEEGGPFDDLYDVVLGAEVAQAFGHALGDEIVVRHGVGSVGDDHADKPFVVVGVLAATGTPVDRSVHVSLEAIEAIHIDWRRGAPVDGLEISADETRLLDLSPRATTAALIGLSSPIATFRFQRYVNEYSEEPLSAVLPGVALQELWGVVSIGETALRGVSVLVIVAALLGMATMLLATLGERRREMAILRAVGARPRAVLALLTLEAAAISAAGVVVGFAVHRIGVEVAAPWIDGAFGVALDIGGPGAVEAAIGATVILAGAVVGLIPAGRAYAMSLADGLTMRM